MTEECRLQAQIDKNLGINLFTEIPEKEYTVIIDAIFGVGLCREVAGLLCTDQRQKLHQ